jgi:hypothetical protein
VSTNDGLALGLCLESVSSSIVQLRVSLTIVQETVNLSNAAKCVNSRPDTVLGSFLRSVESNNGETVVSTARCQLCLQMVELCNAYALRIRF